MRRKHFLELIVFYIVLYYMSCQVAFALTDTQEIRYNATITDSAQIKTEVSNITFEFKEKHLPQGVIFGIPETFEHQYEHIPVTKGRGTLFVDFGKIEKMYDVKKGKEIFPKATLVLIDGQTITGVIGNEGEFGYCIVGDFEFGKFSIELSKLNSILFDVASNQKVPIDIYRRHVIDEKGIATPHLSFKILDKENIETIIHGYRLFRIEDGYNHKDVKEVFPIKYGESIYEIDPTQIAKIANFISTGDQLRVTLVTNTGKEYAGMIPSYEDLYFGGFTNIGFFQIPCTEILSIEKAETKSEISPRQDPRPE